MQLFSMFRTVQDPGARGYKTLPFKKSNQGVKAYQNESTRKMQGSVQPRLYGAQVLIIELFGETSYQHGMEEADFLQFL